MANANNLLNPYSAAVNGRLYEECPKAVFAAIAVSFATSGGENLERADELVLQEWQILYDNGIVPQKPPRQLAALFEEGNKT